MARVAAGRISSFGAATDWLARLAFGSLPKQRRAMSVLRAIKNSVSSWKRYARPQNLACLIVSAAIVVAAPARAGSSSATPVLVGAGTSPSIDAANDVFLRIKLGNGTTSNASFSAVVVLGGVRYARTGTFDSGGVANLKIVRSPRPVANITLTTNPGAQPFSLMARVQTGRQDFTLDVVETYEGAQRFPETRRGPFVLTTYNQLSPSAGYSAFSGNIGSAGRGIFTGTLPDGQRTTGVVFITQTEAAVFFFGPYSRGGVYGAMPAVQGDIFTHAGTVIWALPTSAPLPNLAGRNLLLGGLQPFAADASGTPGSGFITSGQAGVATFIDGTGTFEQAIPVRFADGKIISDGTGRFSAAGSYSSITGLGKLTLRDSRTGSARKAQLVFIRDQSNSDSTLGAFLGAYIAHSASGTAFITPNSSN